MSNVWFVSDYHLNHENIIKYCKRPFKSVKEMNEAIIENHNAVVGEKDDVYNLGDFSLTRSVETVESFVKKLNGKIHLIFGNHDKGPMRQAKGFVWKKDVAKINLGGHKIILFHYPMRSWDSSCHGSYHLYGHCHGNLPEYDNFLSFDVGVDCWNFTPISFEQVRSKMNTKNFIPIRERKK